MNNYERNLKKVCEQAKIIGQLEFIDMLLNIYGTADGNLLLNNDDMDTLKDNLINKFKSIKIIK